MAVSVIINGKSRQNKQNGSRACRENLATKTIIETFEKARMMANHLNEKRGDLAKKKRVLETSLRESVSAVDPKLIALIKASVGGDENACKEFRERRKRVGSVQLKPLMCYMSAYSDLSRLLKDEATLNETFEACANAAAESARVLNISTEQDCEQPEPSPMVAPVVPSIKTVQDLETPARAPTKITEKGFDKKWETSHCGMVMLDGSSIRASENVRLNKSHLSNLNSKIRGDGHSSSATSTARTGGVLSQAITPRRERSPERLPRAGTRAMATVTAHLVKEPTQDQPCEHEALLSEKQALLARINGNAEISGNDNGMQILDKAVKGGLDAQKSFWTYLNSCSRSKQNLLASYFRVCQKLFDFEQTKTTAEGQEQTGCASDSSEESSSETMKHNRDSFEEPLSSATASPATVLDKAARVSTPLLFVKAGPNVGSGIEDLPSPAVQVKFLPMADFLHYCKSQGFISNLQGLESNRHLKASLDAVLARLKLQGNDFGSCQLGEQNLASTTASLTSNLLLGDFKPAGECFLGSGGTLPVNSTNNKSKALATEHEQSSQVSFRSSIPASDLNECSENCLRQGCSAELHLKISVIRRLYNYMRTKSLYFGLYSTCSSTTAFIRDCNGNILITPSVSWNYAMPVNYHHYYQQPLIAKPNTELTLPQFIGLVLLIASQHTVPALEVDGRAMLIPCQGNDCKARDHCKDVEGHPSVVCKSDAPNIESTKGLQHEQKDQKDATSSATTDLHTNRLTKAFTGDLRNYAVGSPVKKKVMSLLEMTCKEILTPVSSGATWRVSFPANGVTQNAILKIADVGKQARLVERLQNEARVYERLASLQGDCIPEIVDYGLLDEYFFYGFATRFEEERPLCQEVFCNGFARKATEALEKIHAMGVLHGHILRSSICCRGSQEKAVFIDFGMADLELDPESDEFRVRARTEMQTLRNILVMISPSPALPSIPVRLSSSPSLLCTYKS
mmetsp:Transcript_10361/g.20411  ORF Transcript_10361/g.20411 Transcript_10361/m.20411 type:complete len:969 (+) Transcript_10361:1186-4092(+)